MRISKRLFLARTGRVDGEHDDGSVCDDRSDWYMDCKGLKHLVVKAQRQARELLQQVAPCARASACACADAASECHQCAAQEATQGFEATAPSDDRILARADNECADTCCSALDVEGACAWAVLQNLQGQFWSALDKESERITEICRAQLAGLQVAEEELRAAMKAALLAVDQTKGGRLRAALGLSNEVPLAAVIAALVQARWQQEVAHSVCEDEDITVADVVADVLAKLNTLVNQLARHVHVVELNVACFRKLMRKHSICLPASLLARAWAHAQQFHRDEECALGPPRSWTGSSPPEAYSSYCNLAPPALWQLHCKVADHHESLQSVVGHCALPFVRMLVREVTATRTGVVEPLDAKTSAVVVCNHTGDGAAVALLMARHQLIFDVPSVGREAMTVLEHCFGLQVAEVAPASSAGGDQFDSTQMSQEKCRSGSEHSSDEGGAVRRRTRQRVRHRRHRGKHADAPESVEARETTTPHPFVAEPSTLNASALGVSRRSSSGSTSACGSTSGTSGMSSAPGSGVVAPPCEHGLDVQHLSRRQLARMAASPAYTDAPTPQNAQDPPLDGDAHAHSQRKRMEARKLSPDVLIDGYAPLPAAGVDKPGDAITHLFASAYGRSTCTH